ncbi:MAG: DMT family transporter, partial [Gemmiger sp.]|nr:DMT family transporter [Gemmiger sp.]
MGSNRVKGAFLTMFGGACWGISGCVGQYLFTAQGMQSTWLVPIRLLLAGLLICGYYFIKDRRLLFAPWKNRRNALDLLIYGVAGVSCCQFLYFLTIQLSTAGMGTILQDLSPVMILAVSCLLGKRLPRLFEVFSILLALGGVFLLTTHGSLTALAITPAALATGLLSAVCVVIYTMWPKNLQRQYPTPLLQGWAFLMGGVLFSLVFRPWRYGYHPTAAGCLGILTVVLVGNVLAFSCYMTGVTLIGPQKSSLYSFAEPAVAA